MKTKLLTPSAIEFVSYANEQMVEQRLRGETPVVNMPSVRRRAYNIVNELNLIAVMDVEK